MVAETHVCKWFAIWMELIFVLASITVLVEILFQSNAKETKKVQSIGFKLEKKWGDAMETMTCKNCGAPLNDDLKCEYCGTQYRREMKEDSMLYIQTCPAEIATLCTQITVADEELNRCPDDYLAERCLKEMTYAIAKQLVPFMDVAITTDPRMMTKIIRGRIRVVEPDFRF